MTGCFDSSYKLHVSCFLRENPAAAPPPHRRFWPRQARRATHLHRASAHTNPHGTTRNDTRREKRPASLHAHGRPRYTPAKVAPRTGARERERRVWARPTAPARQDVCQRSIHRTHILTYIRAHSTHAYAHHPYSHTRVHGQAPTHLSSWSPSLRLFGRLPWCRHHRDLLCQCAAMYAMRE